MKKLLSLLLLAALTPVLSSCGEQKINQQVVIDKSLLEVLQGKGKDGSVATPSGNPSSTPSPTASVDVNINPNVEREIKQAIQDNATALNSQDINAFASSLHPESRFTSFMPDVFYLLVQAQTRYRINGMSVESQSDTSASVLVDRSTSDISGTIEQEILYTMRKSGTSWKVFFMEVQSQGGFSGDEFDDDF